MVGHRISRRKTSSAPNSGGVAIAPLKSVAILPSRAGLPNERGVFCEMLTAVTHSPCDVGKTPMSSFAAHILESTLRSGLLGGGVVAGFLAVTLIPSFSVDAPVEDSIPQLGSRDFGWNANFWDFQLDPPQGSAHGPIKTDPNYPYNSQIQNGRLFTAGELRPPIVNTKDPILKPWAAEQMQATNEEVLSGEKAIPFASQSRCWPGG